MVSVENTCFLLEARRHTFHSRLTYAPVAAALLGGVRLDQRQLAVGDTVLKRASDEIRDGATVAVKPPS